MMFSCIILMINITLCALKMLIAKMMSTFWKRSGGGKNTHALTIYEEICTLEKLICTANKIRISGIK